MTNKKIIALLFFATSLLVGCGEKIDREQYIVSTDVKEDKVEYEFYNNSVVDSGYNWYNTYISNLIQPLKDRDYKIEPQKVKEQIRLVNNKIKEVDGIDPKKVQKAIDLVAKNQSKNNIKDKVYDDKMKDSKKNVPHNIETMVKMLRSIEDGLKLGLDGSFDDNDRSKLDQVQKNLISVYDDTLLIH